MENATITGTIEKVRFTFHSFGEQFVTIDGIEYMTHWDMAQLKKGARVEILVSPPRQNCFVGAAQVVFKAPQAKFIRFAESLKESVKP